MEFDSNGSSKGVVCIADGCTGRRGRGGGTVPIELNKVVSLLSMTKAAVAHNRWIRLQIAIKEDHSTHLRLAALTLSFPLEFRSSSLARSRRRSGTGGGSLAARRCLVEGGGLLLPGALFGSRVARS